MGHNRLVYSWVAVAGLQGPQVPNTNGDTYAQSSSRHALTLQRGFGDFGLREEADNGTLQVRDHEVRLHPAPWKQSVKGRQANEEGKKMKKRQAQAPPPRPPHEGQATAAAVNARLKQRVEPAGVPNVLKAHRSAGR